MGHVVTRRSDKLISREVITPEPIPAKILAVMKFVRDLPASPAKRFLRDLLNDTYTKPANIRREIDYTYHEDVTGDKPKKREVIKDIDIATGKVLKTWTKDYPR